MSGSSSHIFRANPQWQDFWLLSNLLGVRAWATPSKYPPVAIDGFWRFIFLRSVFLFPVTLGDFIWALGGVALPTCECMLSHFSGVWLFATPWTVASQAPLSMGFSRPEKWSGCHFFLQGSSWARDRTLVSYICCTGRWFFTPAPPGKPIFFLYTWNKSLSKFGKVLSYPKSFSLWVWKSHL